VSLRVNNTVIVTSVSLPQVAANTWTQVTGTYTASATGSVALDVFQNLTGQYNDVAIDDISFTASTATSVVGGYESSSNIIVAPNPFSEETMLSSEDASEDILRIELYDLKGTLIQSQTYTGTKKLALGGTLNKGIYLLKIHRHDNIKTLKIIKE
jgi:hypothetical protein